MFSTKQLPNIVLVVSMLALCCLPPAIMTFPSRVPRNAIAITTLPSTASQRQKELETIADMHLKAADRKIAALCRRDYAAISLVFQRGRNNADEFASTCLGWSSKWRLAADAIPFTKGDRHHAYIRDQFEAQIFSESQLEQAIEQTVASFLADIRSVESQMLVDLRADVADFSEVYSVASWSPDLLQSRFDEAIQIAIERTGSDLQANIGTQVVSIIAGEILTQVAIRLGVSAGILGTGAASGWATLGIGVVVGLVIDQLVAWIWDSWADPHGELTQNLVHKLDVLQSLICFGDQNVEGLEQRFKKIAEQRSITRRTAVLTMLMDSQKRFIDDLTTNTSVAVTAQGTKP